MGFLLMDKMNHRFRFRAIAWTLVFFLTQWFNLLWGEEFSLKPDALPLGRHSAIRTQRDIVFQEVDGEKVKADLYRPDSDAKLPAIVMIHGGVWMAGDKWNVIDHARELAEAGFVVMAINYRLAPKFKWPTQLIDCQRSLKWIQENQQEWNLDLDRIGVWGYSAGAQLALMLALDQAKDLPAIRACVAGGAPCDLTFIPEENKMLVAFLGGTRAEYPDRYIDASPVNRLTADDPPLFFFHGTSDLVVPFENSLTSHRKAVECGIQSEHMTVNDVGHLLAFLDRKARSRAIGFLQATLAVPSR
jgi:acetyl esterase/lipase